MSAGENAGRRLVAALTAAGFATASVGRGYVRLCWPNVTDWRRTLVVPVDDSFADYQDSLDEVKAELRDAARRGEAARYALDLHRMEAA
ncbi:hypothetical protein ACH4T9_12490 [Micromonospora sp. NPDC020750]|uniref:hypothetical protein n=1 Tax=unclassified Micromonospora TaxID=2617518 RepID=UPI0037B66330